MSKHTYSYLAYEYARVFVNGDVVPASKFYLAAANIQVILDGQIEKLELINSRIDDDVLNYIPDEAIYHIPLSKAEILEIRELLKRAKGETS